MSCEAQGDRGHCQEADYVCSLPGEDNAGDVRDASLNPGWGRFPGIESHGQRRLEGYSPCSSKESGVTELLTHTYWRKKWQGLGRVSLEMV